MNDWEKAVECLQEIRGCVSPLIQCYERNEDPGYFLGIVDGHLLTAIEMTMSDRWRDAELALMAIGLLISGVKGHVPNLVRLMQSERLRGKLRTLEDLEERMDETILSAIEAIKRDRPKPPIEQRAGMDATPLKLPHAPDVATVAPPERNLRAEEANVPAAIAAIRNGERFKADCELYRTSKKDRERLRIFYSQKQIAIRLRVDRRQIASKTASDKSKTEYRLLLFTLKKDAK